MQFVFGADWSGLNSRSGSSSMNTDILSRLGLGLRGLYQDLTEEPVPDFLAVFIRELAVSIHRGAPRPAQVPSRAGG
jgi:hypothetical protein